MTSYIILKFLHVIGAAVLLGTGALDGKQYWQIRRDGSGASSWQQSLAS